MKACKLMRIAALVALGVSITAAGFVHAESAKEIAQNAFPSVVLLVMEDANGQPLALGSAFFVREDIVATNFHVLEGAAGGYARIVGQKKQYDIAGHVAVDRRRDLALLKIERGRSLVRTAAGVFTREQLESELARRRLARTARGVGIKNAAAAGDLPRAPEGAKGGALILADSSQVAVGDRVYAVGNPMGLEGTFSEGIVSGIRLIGHDTLFQITAPLSPGSSGGPVLDEKGEVIGVAVATFKGGQNLNFAIPASYVSSLLSEVKAVSPLAQLKSAVGDAKKTSIVDELGGGALQGVVATHFSCDGLGDYSFTLRNRLRQPVRDVYCLVVLYDGAGEPLDVEDVHFREVIPAGLAKRVPSQRMARSVYRLWRTPGKVDVRILDFQVLDAADLELVR